MRVADDGQWTVDGNSASIDSETPSTVHRRPSVEELVVLDSAGRLQIPGDQRLLAGIGRRAKVEVVDGGILIKPSDDDRDMLPLAAETATGPSRSSLYSSEPLSAAGEKKTKRRLPWARR